LQKIEELRIEEENNIFYSETFLQKKVKQIKKLLKSFQPEGETIKTKSVGILEFLRMIEYSSYI